MKSPTNIKILKGLSLAIAAEPHAFKLLETFFFIKAMWVAEPMPATVEARMAIAEASLRSSKTIARRLKKLEEMGWVCRSIKGDYECIAWYTLAKKYQISHTHFYHIKPSKHVPLEYILQTKVMSEKKNQCSVAFEKRLHYDKLLKHEMEMVTGSLDTETVANYQLHSFIVGRKGYSVNSLALFSTRYARKESKILRGDVSLSYAKLKEIFGLKGRGSIAHKKRRWQELGLILIQKRVHKIENGIHTTVAKRKTRLGFVKWNTDLNELQLIQPDHIVHLDMQGLDERFRQNQILISHLNNMS